jgi:hypothetical protein
MFGIGLSPLPTTGGLYTNQQCIFFTIKKNCKNAMRRTKAISGLPIMIGTNQFPKPPINVGITMKKIMIKA